MKKKFDISRRQLLPAAMAAGAVAGLGLPKFAQAGTYPDQPINFIVPYGPGGGFDAYVRKFSQLLTTSLSTNVEPINMPGASGQRAVFSILQSPPDGYNISLINIPGIIESKFSKKPSNIDLDKLTWIATLGREIFGVAVGTNSVVKTVADLKKLSAQREIGFGSTGAGSTDYFASHVFSHAIGLRFKEVTGYTSSVDSAVAAARGDIDCVVHSLSFLKQMEAANLVRIIFTFETKSSVPGVDDATTLGLPDLSEIYQWFPVVAPPGLPQPIASKLSNALVAAAKTPDAQAWAVTVKTSLDPLGQKETLAMIEKQTALVKKWKDVL